METEIEEIFYLFGPLEEKKIIKKNQLEKQPQQLVWLPTYDRRKIINHSPQTF